MVRKQRGKHKEKSSRTEELSRSNREIIGLPADVAAIREELKAFFQSTDASGQKLGASHFGVYAFYDYDGEPIYIGQTYEGLSARIGRHLTNRRTDAVAMHVLDPFEVAEVRVWPLNLEHLKKDKQRAYLDRAEYTVFQKALAESKLGAVLNEKPPKPTLAVELPQDYRRRIVPESLYPNRKHPDVRIARREHTIANLARVISERKVSRGLRQTLLTQAQRLDRLAAERLKDFPLGATDESED